MKHNTSAKLAPHWTRSVLFLVRSGVDLGGVTEEAYYSSISIDVMFEVCYYLAPQV